MSTDAGTPLRIATRQSKLALWQAEHVAARLRAAHPGLEVVLVPMTTQGDRVLDRALAQVGGKGLFIKEIEEALLAGVIDLAVHSLKDMPTALPNGLTLTAIPKRENPYDALVGKTLDQLKPGDHIGTSSLRRAAQLSALGCGLVIENLRGNVDTRLRKLDQGQYQAIVLASAGLRRLGWETRIVQELPADLMCPAVGQGALAIETRDDGGPAQQIARQLDHRSSRLAVTAERALLSTLEGGCQVPIGAHAKVEGESLSMTAIVLSPDGGLSVRGEIAGAAESAEKLGRELGARLLEQGAREILQG